MIIGPTPCARDGSRRSEKKSPGTARTGDQPDDQPDYREHQHQQDPEYLGPVRAGRSKDRHRCPDYEGKVNKAEKSGKLGIHVASPSLSVLTLTITVLGWILTA